ncbi:VWA domain-containing protein [uncultured Jatrophihabitans sp.]|uniref:VWA domain-containing protein n=1 Tax=uncultured Jatrophihabitans sp. TaxID=1610747 RepID=UPI0035CC6F7A
MQLALVLNAVSPAIGGVLVRGEKGTAKSTAVRGLAAVMPSLPVVDECRFRCDPADPDPHCPDGPHAAPVSRTQPTRLVELPIGASEDRVVGSLDLERALGEGVRAFEPGLLAAAHRGVLYVDEVNLLADHLVDVLLDAAAMGRNHVERDAVSITHAARFVLIGSMNPEEGELRPQLLDRFGLTVDVSASRDPEVRVDVVRRRLAADADPDAFAAAWADAEQVLTERIAAARTLLGSVELPDSALRQIAEVCAAFDVDGMRADIVTARTAAAHAAWSGRTVVTADDVRAAALLALPHRRRRNPFDEPGLDTEALDDALDRAGDGPQPDPDPDLDPDGGGGDASAPADAALGPEDAPGSPAANGAERTAEAPARSAPTGEAGTARALTGRGRDAATPGRRAPARTGRGRSVGILPRGAVDGPLHLPATLLAAAPAQVARGRRTGPVRFAATDLRRADRRGKEGNFVLFVVDASGSMAARARMSEIKGAVLSLLLDAYRRRDKVGLITFRGTAAEVVLPPTTSVDSAARRLETIQVGGRTPLAAGLAKAVQVVDAERRRDPLRRPLVLLVTDGRGDVCAALRAGADLRRHDVVVIDCESGPVRLGLARRLALELGAEYLGMAAVAARPLGDVVGERRVA